MTNKFVVHIVWTCFCFDEKFLYSEWVWIWKIPDLFNWVWR